MMLTGTRSGAQHGLYLPNYTNQTSLVNKSKGKGQQVVKQRIHDGTYSLVLTRLNSTAMANAILGLINTRELGPDDPFILIRNLVLPLVIQTKAYHNSMELSESILTQYSLSHGYDRITASSITGMLQESEPQMYNGTFNIF